MRWAFCLLLPALWVTLCRETSAEQVTLPDNAALVQGDNQFAVDLYAQLAADQAGKNLFFSPISISMALAMTAAGAHGPTQAEMAKVLHLDADLAQAHGQFHQLLKQWNASGDKGPYQLRVANRLWGQQGFTILPEFLTLTRTQYGAEMTLVDFAQAAAASQQINQWVQQQTNGKIKDLVPADSLGAATRLVLTNAVYFKGNWVHPFLAKNTQPQDFKISAQETVKVPLMVQLASMGYAEDETVQVLEMPYAGNEL
jgi:serpin B